MNIVSEVEIEVDGKVIIITEFDNGEIILVEI